MFRVRKGFPNSAVLQVRSGGQFIDALPLPDLMEGFLIVGEEWMANNDEALRVRDSCIERLSRRIELYERRAATARRSRLKKKAPVLSDAVIEALPKPAKLGAERAAIETAIREPHSIYTQRETSC